MIKSADEYAYAELVTLNAAAKKDASGRSPISMKIYDPGTKRTKYYRTGMYVFQEEFKIEAVRLESVIERASDIINKMRLNSQLFTFDAFERQFKSKGGSVSVIQYLTDAAAAQVKVANADAINDLISVLRRLIKNDNLQFGEITYSWLVKFGRLMSEAGMSDNTVNFHHRTFRKHFNEAVAEGLAPKLDQSPWIGINTQSKPSNNVKRFLTDEEFKIFRDHPYKTHKKLSMWKLWRDLWLTSYYLFGLNLKDILDLKWSDIQGDTIIRSRAKTGGKLTLKVIPALRKIFDQYKENKTYVFEHLRTIGTKEEVEANHNNILRLLVKCVQRICKQAGIKNHEQVNFYSARHTFAVHYMTKEPGASTFKLMLYLGQSSEQSTRNYLQSLIGNEEVKAVSFLDQD